MNEKKNYVSNELKILDLAIDYAEEYSKVRSYQSDSRIRQQLVRIHGGQILAYKEFLRVAWGKAIRIDSEKKGQIIYRLSQSAAVIPKSNMATPQSPIGRTINIARPNDVFINEILGEYVIEDVWYFERYRGYEYNENLKNFKTMSSDGENVFLLTNLIEWLKNHDKETTKIIDHPAIIKDDDEVINWDNVVFKKDEDDDVAKDDSDEINEQKTISLSSKFYVNLNELQYDAAHHGAHGLVYVLGVAGSGKTSVALGRSKSLVQLGQLPQNDPSYNPNFPEETQIGIVRTGELITYLKDTCYMLSLYRLPVVEYKTIYEELKFRWDIDFSQRTKNKPKFNLTHNNFLHKQFYTSIEWFNVVALEMLQIFSKNIKRQLLKKEISHKVASIDGDIFLKIHGILCKGIKGFLDKNNEPIDFLQKVDHVINEILKDLFDRTLWVAIPNDTNELTWFNCNEHKGDIAHFLINLQIPLCLTFGINNKKFLIPKNEKKWNLWLPQDAIKFLKKNESSPKKISLEIYNNNTKETETKKYDVLYVSDKFIEEKIKNVQIYTGISEYRVSLKTKRLSFVNMDLIKSSNEHQENAGKNEREWRKKIRNKVISVIKNIFKKDCLVASSLLKEAVDNSIKKNGFKNKNQDDLLSKSEMLKNGKFGQEDIDLLLAFMASITRSIDKNSIFFNERNFLISPPYRSSVFIDEVQDFSEIQVYLLSLLSNPIYNSITAVGDAAQCLFNTSSDISNCFPKQIWRKAKNEKLTQNIRQANLPTLDILSATFRNEYIDSTPVARAHFNKNEFLEIYQKGSSVEQLRQVYKILSNIPKYETVVIVVPDKERAKTAINTLETHLYENQHRDCKYSTMIDLSKKYIAHVTTPQNIKGLEFDHLIALYLEEYDFNDPTHINSIYVMMSRPKKKLFLIGDFIPMKQKFVELLERFATIQNH